MSPIPLSSLTSLEFTLRNRYKDISDLAVFKPVRAIPLMFCGHRIAMKRSTGRKSSPCTCVVNLEW